MINKRETTKLPPNCEMDFAVSDQNCEITDRLKTASERVGGPDKLALETGIPRRTLSNYLSGRNEPKVSVLVAISKASGLSIEWLVAGEGPKESKSQVNERAQGYEIDRILGLVSNHEAMRGVLVLIEAREDSMEPTIQRGDLLLVDVRDKAISSDGIYVLQLDGRRSAKRCQRMIGGHLYIKNDNPAYETQIVAPELVAELAVVGRVAWIAKRM